MAQLTEPFDGFPDRPDPGTDEYREHLENYDQFMEREREVMDRLEAESDEATVDDLEGYLATFGRADGHAVYRVVADRPGDQIVLQHVPFGDGYAIPGAHLRGLRREDIVQQVEWDNTLSENEVNSE